MIRLLFYLVVINVLVIDTIILFLFFKLKNLKFGGDLIDLCSRFR